MAASPLPFQANRKPRQSRRWSGDVGSCRPGSERPFVSPEPKESAVSVRLAALSVERLSTFCRSPLAATRGTIRTPPEGKGSPRNSSWSSNGSASGWGARDRGAFQDGEDRIYRDGARGARSGEVRGAMNSVRGASPPTSSLKSGRHYPSHVPDQAPEDGSEDPHKTIRGKVASIISRSSSHDPPTLAATRNSSNLAPQTSSATSDLDPLRSTATSTTAVELQEVLVQPSRNLDTDDHHACLDSFRPGAVAVEHLQLNEPQESELSIPKSSESRDTTPGVDFPVSPSSNRNGSNGSISVAASTFVEEAMAAAPPVRKRQQLWRRSSTLVEDLERTTIPVQPPQPSAQSRRSSRRRHLPIALSPNSLRARSLSAPPILRRTSSISEMTM